METFQLMFTILLILRYNNFVYQLLFPSVTVESNDDIVADLEGQIIITISIYHFDFPNKNILRISITIILTD